MVLVGLSLVLGRESPPVRHNLCATYVPEVAEALSLPGGLMIARAIAGPHFSAAAGAAAGAATPHGAAVLKQISPNWQRSQHRFSVVPNFWARITELQHKLLEELPGFLALSRLPVPLGQIVRLAEDQALLLFKTSGTKARTMGDGRTGTSKPTLSRK
eukprot:CAMPEP_0206495380 /NCGR_PEP_ID=MMETSP0324_2-20121206/48493_1 /ASSEMBLY_ACC=CAM_ASM_000836 /TAXON_ID=2866 /ORGANISM="Crypthecodinium cohnii, Strain Seligo" /LENGTH=157 /DNA_ID=CAMNT_0053979623 /DNA_START=149 /DNA_END=623 /DNA_ORIENTATION=+